MKIKYNGQAEQDKFVCNVLNYKKDGFFVEVGSRYPVMINNTFVLEKHLNWSGIGFDIDTAWAVENTKHRPNTSYIYEDAITQDYDTVFKQYNAPNVVDYLQLDIEPAKNTYSVLEKLEQDVMNNFHFRVITFETDVWRDDPRVRTTSRDLLNNHGYHLVFADVANKKSFLPYEDWYVHPDHVNMDYIHKLQKVNRKNYKPCGVNTGKSPPPGGQCSEKGVHESILWSDIIYPEQL